MKSEAPYGTTRQPQQQSKAPTLTGTIAAVLSAQLAGDIRLDMNSRSSRGPKASR